MWEVFEDFVTACFQRYQQLFSIRKQGPSKPLAYIDGKGAFYMKPDISLMSGGKTEFILDTKWKRISEEGGDLKHGADSTGKRNFALFGLNFCFLA